MMRSMTPSSQPMQINTLKHVLMICCLVCCLKAYSQTSEHGHCGNNEQAQRLVALIKQHQQQQRQQLHCHPLLNEIARIKAGLLIENQDIWHNAGHLTPNQLLRHHGFKLPRHYPVFGNQVEALAGGKNSAADTFDSFLNSEPHKKLLLGEDDLFRQQDQIGVAYVKDLSTDHQHHWVVIIAGQATAPVINQQVYNTQAAIDDNGHKKKKKRRRGREIKARMRSHHAKRQGGFELIK